MHTKDILPWQCQSTGDHHAPPILFLHGFMGTSTDWLAIAQAISERYYCILPDLPGHGSNRDRPLSQPFDLAHLSREVGTILDRLESSKVILAGYSMGGRIALHSALQFSHRIRALILESTNPGIEDEETRRHRAIQDDKRADIMLANGMEVFVDQWYEMDLFRSLKTHPGLVEKVKAQRGLNDPIWMAKVIRELSPGRQIPLWNRLKNLSFPVLLITGELDTKYTALMEKMRGKIPDGTLRIVPEAGHNVHLERPDEFIRLMKDFLEHSNEQISQSAG